MILECSLDVKCNIAVYVFFFFFSPPQPPQSISGLFLWGWFFSCEVVFILLFFSCEGVARSFKSFEVVLLLRGRLVSKMVSAHCFILDLENSVSIILLFVRLFVCQTMVIVLSLRIQNLEFVCLFVWWLVCFGWRFRTQILFVCLFVGWFVCQTKVLVLWSKIQNPDFICLFVCSSCYVYFTLFIEL